MKGFGPGILVGFILAVSLTLLYLPAVLEEQATCAANLQNCLHNSAQQFADGFTEGKQVTEFLLKQQFEKEKQRLLERGFRAGQKETELEYNLRLDSLENQHRLTLDEMKHKQQLVLADSIQKYGLRLEANFQARLAKERFRMQRKYCPCEERSSRFNLRSIESDPSGRDQLRVRQSILAAIGLVLLSFLWLFYRTRWGRPHSHLFRRK